jgi:transcriptional regulator with XRE-family HTH domain
MFMIGQRLRDLRENHGLSREALAQEIGVSPQQIYRWETGENDPTGDLLAKLSHVLVTSTDYLLGLVDTPLPHTESMTAREVAVMGKFRRRNFEGVFKEVLDEVTSQNTEQSFPAKSET